MWVLQLAPWHSTAGVMWCAVMTAASLMPAVPCSELSVRVQLLLDAVEARVCIHTDRHGAAATLLPEPGCVSKYSPMPPLASQTPMSLMQQCQVIKAALCAGKLCISN